MSTNSALAINPQWSRGANILTPGKERFTHGASPLSQLVDHSVLTAFRMNASPRPRVLFLGSQYLDYMKDNWDGEGAKAISLRAIRNTDSFLAALGEMRVIPEDSPSDDGYIELDWYVNPDNVFSIGFGPSNIVAYSGIFGGKSKAYGTEDVSDGISPTIWSYIQRISKMALSSGAA